MRDDPSVVRANNFFYEVEMERNLSLIYSLMMTLKFGKIRKTFFAEWIYVIFIPTYRNKSSAYYTYATELV